MKLAIHPHRSDVLTVTLDELKRIENGEELTVSALIVRLEKPDTVVYPSMATSYKGNQKHDWFIEDKLKLVFDGKTGELKSAEVI